MSAITRGRPARRPSRSIRCTALVLAMAGAGLLALAPAVAQAGVRPVVAKPAASICGKVSASRVSSIIGYTVSAATSDTTTVPANKSDGGIASHDVACVFSDPTATASASNPLGPLGTNVYLDLDTPTKPITAADLQALIDAAEAQAAHFHVNAKWTAYPGLGFPAYAFGISSTTDGFTFSVRGIFGLSDYSSKAKGYGGGFGAVVFNKTLTMSKLAALCQLARQL